MTHQLSSLFHEAKNVVVALYCWNTDLRTFLQQRGWSQRLWVNVVSQRSLELPSKLSEMKQSIRMRASSLPRETDPASNSSSKRIGFNKRQDGTSSGRLLQNGYFPSFLLALFCFALFRCLASSFFVFETLRGTSAGFMRKNRLHRFASMEMRPLPSDETCAGNSSNPEASYPPIFTTSLENEVSERNMKNIA